MTPPTMALMFVDFCSEGPGVEFDVDDGVNKLDKTLELEARGLDVCSIDLVVCKVGLAEEVLRTELEADVVVASTAFGTARRLSVPALSEQAMYSND
jgi:hypothetical protein